MDLINKDQAVAQLDAQLKHIRQCVPGCDGNVNFSYGFRSGFEAALRRVEEMPVTRGGAWVLPEDQLPEEGALVLVTCDGEWLGENFIQQRRFINGEFCYFKSLAGVYSTAGPILAWMYEPEAYHG